MKMLSLQRMACRDRDGFTILELLVAAVVLGLMTTMTVSLISNVTATSDRTHRRMDTDASARIALECIGSDLERMLKRSDIDYGFHKRSSIGNNNDSLCFYTTSRSFDDPGVDDACRQLSVVSYRIKADYRLERGVKTIADRDWETPVFVSASSQTLDREDFSGNAKTELNSTRHYQGLGEDVMRLEFAYLVNDPVNGVKIDTVAPSRFSDLRGLVIAVAVLDGKSRALLSVAQLDFVAGLLGDAQKDTAILPLWEIALRTQITDPKVRLAVSNLRFYQRYYFFQ